MATVSDKEEVELALCALQGALERKYPRTTDDGPYIQIRSNSFELIDSRGAIVAETSGAKIMAAVILED